MKLFSMSISMEVSIINETSTKANSSQKSGLQYEDSKVGRNILMTSFKPTWGSKIMRQIVVSQENVSLLLYLLFIVSALSCQFDRNKFRDNTATLLPHWIPEILLSRIC